jgi:hypothetical protein
MNLKKNVLFGIAMLVCLLIKFNETYAQSEFQADSIRIAKIDAPVPYFKLLAVEDQNLLILEPSDLCGKISIVELWSIKNKSSTNMLSHYEYLKKLFGDAIKIILVTEDNLEDIQNFVKKNNSSLTFAIDSEKSMNYLFPHSTSPHAIVINAEGIIKAITYPEELTMQNILSIVKNEPVSIKLKSELLPNQDATFVESKISESVFKINIKSYDSEKQMTYEWLSDNEFIFTNYAVASIYQSLYNVTPVRTRIESKKAHWYRTNHNSFLCFEMKMPYLTKQEMKKEAIVTLNKALPLKSKLELRSQKGYSLAKIAEGDSSLIGEQLKVNGFTIRTLKDFVQLMEIYELVDAPIINDTELSLDMPINIEGLPRKMPELSDALKKYGFSLVEKQFTTDFLILYDENENQVSSSKN